MTDTATPAPGTSRTVDAHHHFWHVAAQEQSWRTPSHEAIARDYLPEDLRAQRQEAGVDATVLVQSVDSPAENDRLRGFVEQEPTVAGVVGWLPLRDAGAAGRELERAWSPAWSGVRCLVAREPLGWLTDPATVELFRELVARDLAWDVVPVTEEQVSAVLALAEAVPDLRIIVDHLARPPVDGAGWEPWASHVARLAACPGVAMKVSVGIDVLTSWSSWDGEALLPYVGWALDCFGPERLMLASNWPVVLLRAGYGEAWRALREAVSAHGVDGSDLAAVLGGTATQWYRLPAVRTGGS